MERAIKSLRKGLMRLTLRFIWPALAAGFLLTACAQVARHAPQSAAVDDEAHCSNVGAPGTDAFAKCLKDRDIARDRAEARVESAHRGLSERMMNGR